METNSINDYLISLLKDNNYRYNDIILPYLYLTLLSLNSLNYHESMSLEDISNIEDLLRKINNLKVKIQLKRKPEEIDKLITNIKSLLVKHNYLINIINKDNLDIESTISSKDTNNITNMIDILTKEKNIFVDKKETYDNIRDMIIINNYQIKDNNIYLDDKKIDIFDFTNTFIYLLNKNNYHTKLLNDIANNSHNELIDNLINLIINKDKYKEELIIPIITVYLFINNKYTSSIATNKFNIDNIKISDLYNLAKENSQDNNHAKWKNISIPNEYLFQKIHSIILKGTYYYEDNKFILEELSKHISEFKISISINDMKEFLIKSLKAIN